jgi:hypothetical protein
MLLGCNPVNDRITSARFKTMTGSMTVCLVHASTILANDQEGKKSIANCKKSLTVYQGQT